MCSSQYGTGFSPGVFPGPQPVGPRSFPAGMFDSLLAGTGNTSTKQGYTFTYSATADTAGRYDTYSITAVPTPPGTTGTNYYYTDHTGAIRQNSTRPATAADPPMGG